MNLKEAFKYQNFLSSLMTNAKNSIIREDHCLKSTRRHLINDSNPDAEDKNEVIEARSFVPNDIMLCFMKWIIDERYKLTRAITLAKAEAGIDVDAAIEMNKARQTACDAIRKMLQYTALKTADVGRGYKFNAEGNQIVYLYKIEIEKTEMFNRSKAKELMYQMVEESGKVSSEIDAALVNTNVDYHPIYSVNVDFDDIVRKFAESQTI